MITIDIPTSVTSHFVIAADDPPDDPLQKVREHLEGPLRSRALELLERSSITVQPLAVHESGWGSRLLGAAGVSAEDLVRLRDVEHHLVVTSRSAPGQQPGHAQAARAVARMLAAWCEGLLYDDRTNQVLPDVFGAEPEVFRLADNWLAVFITGDDYADALNVVRGDKEAGEQAGEEVGEGEHVGFLRLVTAGLHRFGLPELCMGGALPDSLLGSLGLIRGIAHRLLTRHWDWLAANPGREFRRLGSLLEVEDRDVQRYLGQDPPAGRRRAHGRVQLVDLARWKPGEPPCLGVNPPGSLARSQAAWVADFVGRDVPDPIASAH